MGDSLSYIEKQYVAYQENVKTFWTRKMEGHNLADI